MREPIERACETLQTFLAGPRASALGDLSFYGYSLVEYIATVDVVGAHFPLPPESIDPDVARYLQESEQA